MANYRDIIAGTISAITEKARAFAQSDTVTNLTGKVREAAETSGVRDFYEKGASKTKAYANIAKLMLKENGETEELKKVYTEIGKLYYEQQKDDPQGFFAPLFAQVQEHVEAIRSIDAEVAAIKDELGLDKDADVSISDFEEIVSADEDENKSE